MPDDAFESCIFRFEEDWRRDGPREIADYLDHTSAQTPDERRRRLVELIAIDLEFRWRSPRADRRMMLEDYAARFPELGPLDEWPPEVIGEEYRARRNWGDRPTHAEFLSRFHDRHEAIRAELLRIDRELEEESADPPEIPPSPAVRSRTTDPSPDGPVLSHQDFLLQRMIGAGRMGKVYQAWRHSESRPVAVKFLRKTLLDQPGVVQRFLGEARTVARLRHPNIVGIHGLGRTPGGAYFLVMDLVAGPNLDHLIRSRVISIEEALRWTIEACQALEHAHARGIIHCDLKPANLLLDEDGHLRVTDFGLARSLTEQNPWTAEIEGTAPFMAPEQAARCWGPISTRTDVYGIGAVLYTLLTGRPPWVGRRLPDILADVISAAPVIPPDCLHGDLPKSVGDICQIMSVQVA
jgi:hypothetical protein